MKRHHVIALASVLGAAGAVQGSEFSIKNTAPVPPKMLRLQKGAKPGRLWPVKNDKRGRGRRGR